MNNILCFPLKKTLNIPGSNIDQAPSCLLGSPCNVRRDHTVLTGKQRIIRFGRLHRYHVNTCSIHLTAVKSLRQILFHNRCAMVSLQTRSFVCSFNGQSRKITSDSFKSCSLETYSPIAFPSGVSWEPLVITLMPNAFAARPMALPVCPKPIIPAVL